MGDDIRITVLSVQGKQVKIGITLPPDKVVYREEVYRRVMGRKPHGARNQYGRPFGGGTAMARHQEMTPEHGTDGTMTNGAATNTVRAQTRLGMLDIDPSKELFFPRGLMGFEEHHRFTLLKIRGEAPFLILQSLDDPKLGLLVGDPYAFLPEYRIRIGDAEQKMLQAADISSLSVLVTVSIPHGQPENTSLSLSGPIVINHEARLGLQILQADVNPPRVCLHLNRSGHDTDESGKGTPPGQEEGDAS